MDEKLMRSISMHFFSLSRRKLFDEAPEDNNYAPLPEDRPGGFNWGEERAQNNPAENDE